MPTVLLIGVAALALFLWFKSGPSIVTRADLAQALRAFMAVFGGLATTGLAVGGRWGLAGVTLIATLAALRSLIAARRGATPIDGNRGKTSTVETASLKMRLEHATGEIDGAVKRGQFAGAVLSVLQLQQLLQLHAELRASDVQSIPLLETFLDRQHPDWRDAEFAADAADEAPMSEALALRTLGLGPDATAEEIKAAHRRLMASVHPDRGGSDQLAAQVNAAREFLLQLRG